MLRGSFVSFPLKFTFALTINYRFTEDIKKYIETMLLLDFMDIDEKLRQALTPTFNSGCLSIYSNSI